MLSSTGDIQYMTLPWLILELRKGRKTGTVFFEHETRVVKIFFRQGEIIFVSSNTDDDSVAEYLLSSGKITKDHLDKASKTKAKNGKKIGSILFEMGILTPQELVAQTKLQAKRNILNLFSWREGRYRYEDGVLAGAEIVPFQMNTAELILEGIRSLDWQNIRASLPSMNTIIRKASDPSPSFQASDLDPTERTILSLIDGKSSIQDLCNASNLGDLKTLSALYILLALKLAEKGAVKDQDEREFLFRDEQRSSDDTAPDVVVTETTVNKELLQNAYDSLDIQNYYEVLGVGHSATPQEIRKAYYTLSKLYHPDRYTDPQYADIQQKMKTLFESINEAYHILRIKEKRDQYNLDLASGIKKYGQETRQPMDLEEINKTAAIAQFAEGMKQFRVQNFWGAEEAFRGAVRLDPSKAEYLYYQALSLAHMPRRRHEAEEFFVKAIKLAPSHIDYYLELGNFYMKDGLKPKALVVYQNALKRDPKSEKIKLAIKAAGK